MTNKQKTFIRDLSLSHGKRIAKKVAEVITKGDQYRGIIGKYNGHVYTMRYHPKKTLDIYGEVSA